MTLSTGNSTVFGKESSTRDWTESTRHPRRQPFFAGREGVERVVWNDLDGVRMETSGWLRFPAGHQGLAHSHDYWELVYTLSGSGSFQYKGREFSCSPGSAFLFSPGEPHQTLASPREELCLLYLGFSMGATLDRPAVAVDGPIGQDRRLSGFLQEEMARLRPDPKDRPLKGIQFQTRFLPMVCRIVDVLQEPRANSDWMSPHQAVVAKAKAYLAANLRDRMRIAVLAREACMSAPYFGKVFGREVGMSPKEYLNALRLDRAKELLQNPSLSIGEVAAAVGMPDAGYFTRLFKKRFKVPPRQLRNP